MEFTRPLDERAVEQMVLGISSRRYARSLEPILMFKPEWGTLDLSGPL
jgi:hypothetical protein